MQETYNQGNFKDAYEGFRKLALDPQNDPRLVGDDLNMAVQCLQQLNRVDEIDALLEDVGQGPQGQLAAAVARRPELHEHPAPRLHRGRQVLSRQPARRRQGGQLRRARPRPRPAIDGPGHAAWP